MKELIAERLKALGDESFCSPDDSSITLHKLSDDTKGTTPKKIRSHLLTSCPALTPTKITTVNELKQHLSIASADSAFRSEPTDRALSVDRTA